MAQALPAIGAFIIAYGPVILTTLSLAASIYMAFSAPGPPEGPKIGDTRVQTSTYGKVIPVGFGRIRLAGNIIWALDIQEVRNKVSVGGKGGGKSTQYTYFAHFAVGLAEGPAVACSRIWADKKIILDLTGNSEKPRKYRNCDIRFYGGEFSQLPDPMIEADLGVGSTPAFRGRCYVVFEDLPVADMGNRIPHMEFEIQFKTPVSTVTTELPQMFDWAIDHIMPNYNTGYLYMVHRRDVRTNYANMSIAIMDKYTDTVIKETAGYPYPNEKNFGANGYRPYMIHPGDDGRLWSSGVSASGGAPALTQINPYNLTLLHHWDLRVAYDLSQTINWRASTYWKQSAGMGTYHYGAMFFNGEQGGFADTANDKWLFYERGTIDPAYADGNEVAYADLDLDVNGDVIWPVGTYLHEFPFQAGPNVVWAMFTAVDQGGNLWVCGWRMDDMERGVDNDRGAKLWRVHLRMDGKKMKFSLSEYDLTDIDPEGLITRPHLMTYDRATNTLTIWGDNEPTTGDYSIVQFDLATKTIINRVSYDLPGDAKYQPHGFASQHGGVQMAPTIVSHFQNGTNTRGDLIYEKWSPTADDQWVKYNAWDFSFTYPIEGPRLDAFISQYYWDHDLEKVWIWPGPSTDNPTDEATIVYYRQVIANSNDYLDLIVKSLIADVHVDVLTEVSTDATMQATVIDGFIVGSQGSVRSAINPLGFAYFFDAVESDSKIAFRSRGTSSIRTIDEADLGSKPGSEGKGEEDVLVTNREQETDIPARVDLIFMDVSRDYLDGNQHAQRMENPTPTQFSKSVASNSLPIVMDPDRAKSIAEAKLYDSWAARMMHKFQFGPKHMDLEPTDVITIDTTTVPDIVMRVSQTQLGEAFVTRAESVTHDMETLVTVGTGAGSEIGEDLLEYQGPTLAHMLDITLLRDQDDTGGVMSNVYVAMGGMRDAWVAGVIVKSAGTSSNGPFEYFEASRGETTWGYVEEDVAALPNAFWQDDTLQSFNKAYTEFQPEMSMVIQIVGGIDLLESRTLTEINETGENTVVLLHDSTPKENFEILQFTDVSISSDEATLTGLMRGVRGTEEGGQYGFPRGSLAVFPDDDVATIKVLPLTDIGEVKYYATETARESEPTSISFNYTHNANDLKPLPVGYSWMTPAVGSRSAVDVKVSGYRRTRIGGDGDFNDGQAKIIYGEDALAYECDLINKTTGAVAWTFYTADYTATVGFPIPVARRTAAGYTSNEAFTVKVYQVSSVAEVGRGLPRKLTG